MANPFGVTQDPALNLRLGLGSILGLNTLYEVQGVPPNALGQDGDVAFRRDGGAGTVIYQRRAGVWVATGA